MSVHLITGYKGEEHIQSQDTRSFNAAMFGDGEFVMEIGEQLEGSIIDNNTVRLLDGDILMQGGHIRIESGTFEDLTIDTGEAGYYRNDLIVMTYEKNAEDTTETAYLEVVKGTPTSGTPDDPEYTVGVLADGDLKNQMPLYRVKIEGVVLSDIESLFDTIPTYKTLALEAAATYKTKLEALRGTDLLDTYEEIDANTQSLKFAGAIGVKQGIDSIKSSLTNYSGSTLTNPILDSVYVNNLSKIGKSVNFYFSGVTNASKSITANSTVLATLSQGYRPARETHVMGLYSTSQDGSNHIHTRFVIKTNGEIVSPTNLTMRYLIISATFGIV